MSTKYGLYFGMTRKMVSYFILHSYLLCVLVREKMISCDTSCL